MDSNQINKKIAKGAIWMVALRFSIKGIGLISTLILVRLLSPENFGLMALAMSVYAMIELMQAFGFNTALIQNQKSTREHYDTAWTLQIFFGLFASSLIILISDYAADFYGDHRISAILKVMGLLFLINAFANIGVVKFSKEMDFNKEFTYRILIKLSAFSVTVSLAFYWHSYWALLMGMLASALTSLILSYTMQSYRPKITFKEWRSLFGFSSWLFINNLLSFINNHSQNFILGKLSGAKVLGLYSVSYEVSTLTTAEIVAPINRAAFPGYSKMADNKEKLKASYLTVLSHIILIAVPSAVGIAVIAPLIVPVLLGETWLDTIPLMKIIALASALESINTNAYYIYLALAKQKITTKLLCLRLVIYLPLLFSLTSKQGAIGAALATLATALLMFPASQLILKRQLLISWIDIFAILYRPVIAAMIMAACVYQYIFELNNGFFMAINPIFQLAIGLLIGVISFTLSLILIWWGTGKKPGAEKWILVMLKEKILSNNK